MELDFDLPRRTVSFTVPKSLYSEDALRVAAHVLAKRAVAEASDEGKRWCVELAAAKKSAGEAELAVLAGEFMNELLNQEYRFLVSNFNKKISGLIVTQALFAARGGENPPRPPKPTPEFEAQVAAMMKRAQDEIDRTMPKRLPRQGKPLAEAADA